MTVPERDPLDDASTISSAESSKEVEEQDAGVNPEQFHGKEDNNNSKNVSFRDQPLILKLNSGAYELEADLDTTDGDGGTGSTMHRRASAVNRPTFGAEMFKNLSLIPPPVPESLPTTPGFELSGDMYFNRQKDPLVFPEQQQFISREQSESNLLDLMQRPASEATAVEKTDENLEMTLKNPPKNLWRVLGVCLWAFSGGMSDGAPGAILLNIENYYDISYSVVSLIWLSNAIGFILIALVSNKMDASLGKQKMICLGCFSTMIMYSIVSSGTKFAAICVGFFFGGLGLATCLSQMNIFLSRLDKASTYLGWFHGSYGIGATIAPIVATSMVNAGIKWHLYYLILLGLAVANAVNLYFAFIGADEDLRPWDHQEVIHTEDDEPVPEDEVALRDLDLRSNLEHTNRDYRNGSIVDENSDLRSRKSHLPPEPVVPKGDFKLLIKNSRTWLLMLFVFFYQGAEVSLPGWLETFLTEYRHGDPLKLGYVASGFWAGLTIGRLFLVERIHKGFGAKRGVTILGLGAIVFVAAGWAVDHIIVEAVLISISGIFVGPIYPLMITIATRVLPRKIQVISVTIMTSGGSSGGALWPFLTGLISQYSGAFVVMPVFIALFSVMIVCWFMLPNPDRSIVKTPWQRLL